MILTDDCTMEHRRRRTDKPAVDSGTQAGIHVPVCDFRSIAVASGILFSSRLLP